MLSIPRNVTSVPVLIAACLPLSGCLGDLIGIACTSELRSNLVVEVRDSSTETPAAWGVTGVAVHEDGRATSLSALDSLNLFGNWAREQAGEYSISVRRPGYTPAQIRATVDDDACHVKTRRVRMSIAVNPSASPQSPLFLTLGDHVLGGGASAGITTVADTLMISGRAYAPCTNLVVLASRSARELHVQLQPENSSAGNCGDDDRLQQFSAAYLLPSGPTELYLTNAFGEPTVLFTGSLWIE